LQVQHTEFDFRRVRFELIQELNVFRQVRFPDCNTARSYLTSKGFDSEVAVISALEKWGTNTVEVPAPSFSELLMEQMLAPFFIFQVRHNRTRLSFSHSLQMSMPSFLVPPPFPLCHLQCHEWRQVLEAIQLLVLADRVHRGRA
jgi:hypothetical protein